MDFSSCTFLHLNIDLLRFTNTHFTSVHFLGVINSFKQLLSRLTHAEWNKNWSSLWSLEESISNCNRLTHMNLFHKDITTEKYKQRLQLYKEDWSFTMRTVVTEESQLQFYAVHEDLSLTSSKVYRKWHSWYRGQATMPTV